MRIVMFGHKRIPSREGGIEIVVEELASRMVAQGHSVTCCNRGGHHVSGAEFDIDVGSCYKGIRLKTVPTVDKKGLAAVTSSFFAAIYSAFSSADVVHIHAEGPAFMCWLPKLLRKKVVVTVHGLDWQREKWKRGFASRYIRMGEKMAVRFADEIIVLSRNAQRYFQDTYGRETIRIPNGVHAVEPIPAKEICEKYDLEENGYFLQVGRLVPEKGIHYLIRAFRQVNTDKKLVIVGGTSDSDDYVEALKAAAAKDERVILTGFIQGKILEELFSNAYAFVQPSDVEGMPLTLLEAISYGKCCVTSDIPECTEVTGEKGISFPRGNVAALADRLQTLCDDPAFVQSCRTCPPADYNWDEIVHKTLELYQ